MSSKRVVITGVGAMTALGRGGKQTWQGLLEGRTVFSRVSSFVPEGYTSTVGAEIIDFDPEPGFRHLRPDRCGRASQLAVNAARPALVDAGIELLDAATALETAVVVGTTSGEPREVERYTDLCTADKHDEIGDFIDRYACHAIAATVAAELGLGGPVHTVPTACAAGSYAVARATALVASGRAELALAGGADAFSRITYAGFSRLGAIAQDCCRPFDLNRAGMIPGEGAAFVVLEPLERALQRGAPIYAEVLGWGLSCDAHHMTGSRPDAGGAVQAMSAALNAAGVNADEVDYVSAHGTGTPANDRGEAMAVREVFGERKVVISSVKSMIGHTMGAASAIEAMVCALAIAESKVPPTMGFQTPDPEIPLDCVPNEARDMTVDVAMSNAYAFGGTNASLILGKLR